MPEENPELLDAREFKRKFIVRTKNSNDEEGQRIGEYLNNIMPDWQGTRATRLYKHIQDMLKNAEEIRRFEIEIVWKRGIYITSLIIFLSTAFGYLFLNIYLDDITKKNPHYGGEEESLYSALALIALFNAFLSFCLLIINIEGNKWQKNWEHHVDYLQAILGFNLMRVTTRPEKRFFTITKINIYVSALMSAIWFCLAIAIWIFGDSLLYSLSVLLNFSLVELVFLVGKTLESTSESIFRETSISDFLILLVICFLSCIFLISLMNWSVLKLSHDMYKPMYIRDLRAFSFTKRQLKASDYWKILYSFAIRYLYRIP